MKVEVDAGTLIRLGAIALAYDVITPNTNKMDEYSSKCLRQELSKLPLSQNEFKCMVETGLQLIENSKA